jgi:hypothetical protein
MEDQGTDTHDQTRTVSNFFYMAGNDGLDPSAFPAKFSFGFKDIFFFSLA